MGQTLAYRPISQRSSFATLGTGSSANAPDQSQYQGFTSPMPQPSQPAPMTAGQDPGYGNTQIGNPPSVLGGGFGRFNRMMNLQ